MTSPPKTDRQPRVLFLAPSFEVGGAERQLSLLVPALQARGFDTSVVTIRGRGEFVDDLEQAGVDVRLLEVRSRFDAAGVRRLLRAVGTWPEIVVSQSLDAQLVAQLVARQSSAEHLTIHHGGPALATSPHRRLLTRIVARGVAGVVAVSKAQAPSLTAAGFAAERVTIIGNGVGEPDVRQGRAELRMELGVDLTSFVALLAATLRREKRAHVFVDAIDRAHEQNEAIVGLVAGQGPELERVATRAQRRGNVKTLGERRDLADLMAASDVVCLTSEAEALPMVVLEAMASARPVIAPDVGGISDAVVDGETGFLTPVDDGEALASALDRLALDPALARQMGEAGRARYEAHFTVQAMADKYAAVLDELVAKRRSRG